MPTGRLRPSQVTNTPPAAARPDSTAWVKVTCGMGDQHHGQIGQRNRDLGQVLRAGRSVGRSARGGVPATRKNQGCG